MKILFCCEFYYPSTGGVQKVIQEVAENLTQMGHRVTIATSLLTSRQSNTHNGVYIKEFNVHGNQVNGLTGDINEYQNYVVNGGFDMLVVKAAQQWTFDALIPVLHNIKYPKIHIPCGYSGLHNKQYKQYFRHMPEILKQFDHLIFYASNYRDINLAKLNNITNFSIIPNGASENEFKSKPSINIRSKLNISPGDFVFLSVGTPPFNKGHLEILDAYSRLIINQPSTLVLNGNYDTINATIHQSRPARYIKILRDKRLLKFKFLMQSISSQPSKNIIVTNLNRQDLIALYFSSNLFVFASHIEYSPLVLFEAAAAGLPFISNQVGNATEIAEWTHGGEIYKSEILPDGNHRIDPIILSATMSNAANDHDKLSKLGKQGRSYWKSMYTWSTISKQYENIMLELINR